MLFKVRRGQTTLCPELSLCQSSRKRNKGWWVRFLLCTPFNMDQPRNARTVCGGGPTANGHQTPPTCPVFFNMGVAMGAGTQPQVVCQATCAELQIPGAQSYVSCRFDMIPQPWQAHVEERGQGKGGYLIIQWCSLRTNQHQRGKVE